MIFKERSESDLLKCLRILKSTNGTNRRGEKVLFKLKKGFRR